MKPFVTVIIPVYNIKENYLRACFRSLLEQDLKDFLVIVIDDGSSDDSGTICDEYAHEDPRIRVIHQENAGVSAARNAGLKEIQTEWTLFVDPDDWLEPDTISTLFHFTRRIHADIFLFDYMQEFSGKQIKKRFYGKSGKLPVSLIKSLRLAPFNNFFVNGKPYEYETNVIWNKLYRTSLIRDHHMLFDPKARKGQDVIFNAEIFQLTSSYCYISKTLYHYRYLEESVTNRFNPKVRYYNEIAFHHYERIIREYRLTDEYLDAYYARVVTRLYSCMRLYYFHPENTTDRKKVYRELNALTKKSPYKTALHKVRFSQLSASQKLFVFFLKRHRFIVLRFLVSGRNYLKILCGKKLG